MYNEVRMYTCCAAAVLQAGACLGRYRCNCRAPPNCAPSRSPLVLWRRLVPAGSLYRKQNIVTILYGTSLTNKSALEIARQHAFAATHFSHTVRAPPFVPLWWSC